MRAIDSSVDDCDNRSRAARSQTHVFEVEKIEQAQLRLEVRDRQPRRREALGETRRRSRKQTRTCNQRVERRAEHVRILSEPLAPLVFFLTFRNAKPIEVSPVDLSDG